MAVAGRGLVATRCRFQTNPLDVAAVQVWFGLRRVERDLDDAPAQPGAPSRLRTAPCRDLRNRAPRRSQVRPVPDLPLRGTEPETGSGVGAATGAVVGDWYDCRCGQIDQQRST
jgi:hypothetical protein